MRLRRRHLPCILAVAVWGALFLPPPRASYACHITDFECMKDSSFYMMQELVTSGLWAVTRMLLLGARAIEGFRVWLTTDVLPNVFTNVLRGLEGTFVVTVMLALLMFWLSFFVQGVITLNWVDIRRALRNGFFALFVFYFGAHAVAAIEIGRVQLSSAFGQIASTAVQSTGGQGMTLYAASDWRDPVSPPGTIYAGDDPCGLGLPRAMPVIMLNDLAATYALADARDIHCPDPAADEPGMPVAFWDARAYTVTTIEGGQAITQTPGYFRLRNIEEVSDATTRARALGMAGVGVTRMSFSVPFAFLAVLEQVIQLIYALCLMALWFALAVSLIFSLFVPTESMMTGVIDSALKTIRSSIVAGIWVGVGSAALQIAAAGGGARSARVDLPVAGAVDIPLAMAGPLSRAAAPALQPAAGGNGLVVGLVALLVLGLFLWLIREAAAIFVSAMGTAAGATVGAAPAAMAAALAAGAAIAAMGTAGVAVKKARQWSVYHTSRRAFTDAYGDETEQQRAAASQYASERARQAGGSVGQDIQRVMRAGLTARSLVSDPLGTMVRLEDRAEIRRSGFREQLASPPTGLPADEGQTPNEVVLSSAHAGTLAAGSDPQARKAGETALTRLRRLTVQARRDGMTGQRTAVDQVDRDIDQIDREIASLEAALDDGVLTPRDAARATDRLRTLWKARDEQRDLRDQLGQVTAQVAGSRTWLDVVPHAQYPMRSGAADRGVAGVWTGGSTPAEAAEASWGEVRRHLQQPVRPTLLGEPDRQTSPTDPDHSARVGLDTAWQQRRSQHLLAREIAAQAGEPPGSFPRRPAGPVDIGVGPVGGVAGGPPQVVQGGGPPIGGVAGQGQAQETAPAQAAAAPAPAMPQSAGDPAAPATADDGPAASATQARRRPPMFRRRSR